MAELRVSTEAANDLREIRQYIAVQLDAPAAAPKLVYRIAESIVGQRIFPKAARLCPPC